MLMVRNPPPLFGKTGLGNDSQGGFSLVFIVELKNNNSLDQVQYAQTTITVGAGKEHQRDVNLSISYPSGNNKYPLIVFSHGHALDNPSYRNLTDYWVERGYVVVAPLHLDRGGDLGVAAGITKKYVVIGLRYQDYSSYEK